MPSTAPVQVPITVDNATAAGIQSAVANLRSFEAAGIAAGRNTGIAFDSARGAAALFGQEIGVPVNRYLRQILGTSTLLAPVLESIFPVVAAVGFGEILFDVGEKIFDFASGAKEAAEQAKSLSDNLAKMANVRGQILGQATSARGTGALIGLSGSSRDQEEINQLNELLLENQARVRQTRDNIFGLQQGLIGAGNGFKTASEEVISLNGTLGDLEAREELLEQQLSNATSQEFVNQRKEEADKAKKEAEELKKLSDALEQVDKGLSKFGGTSFSQDSITRVFGSAQGSPSVSRPGGGSLSQFGINNPIFPLFATKDQLDIAKQYGFVIAGVTQQTLLLSAAQKTLDDALTKGFDNAFQDIALGTRSVGEAFESLAASVAASVLQMVAKLLILPPIISALNSLLGAIGLGTGGKSDIPLFGGIGGQVHAIPHAAGGPVMPGNTYLVGERGPELFHAGSTSGFITPNGAGASVQVNVINQSSQPVSARSSRSRVTPQGIVTDVFLEDMKTNGPIRQALKGM